MVCFAVPPPLPFPRVHVSASALIQLGGEPARSRRLLAPCIQRFVAHDWGDIDAGDRAANDRQAFLRQGRITGIHSLRCGGLAVRLFFVYEFLDADVDPQVPALLLILRPDDY